MKFIIHGSAGRMGAQLIAAVENSKGNHTVAAVHIRVMHLFRSLEGKLTVLLIFPTM